MSESPPEMILRFERGLLVLKPIKQVRGRSIWVAWSLIRTSSQHYTGRRIAQQWFYADDASRGRKGNCPFVSPAKPHII